MMELNGHHLKVEIMLPAIDQGCRPENKFWNLYLFMYTKGLVGNGD